MSKKKTVIDNATKKYSMKKIFDNIIVLISFLGVLGFASCQETEYMKFDMSHNGIYFTKDTLKYSFSVTPLEVRSYEFRMPIKILGCLSSKVREVAYRINPDSTNAEEGVHYSMGKAVILPDSIEGYIPVTIYRDNLKGSYKDGYERYKLCVELVKNDNFMPTLDLSNQVRILQFDNAIDNPDWVDWKNEKIWRPGNPHDNLGSWHPYTYMKLVEQFHTVKDVPYMEEIYDKMVALYGENLEHVPYASFSDYMSVIRKYVLAPLYEYFSNPENKEEILSLYDDYPFDFPNPYEK